MNKKMKYTQLATTKISETRDIVVSRCSEGFTVAQKMSVKDDNGKVSNVFMKGAFHAKTVDELWKIHDVIEEAIGAYENPDENWE